MCTLYVLVPQLHCSLITFKGVREPPGLYPTPLQETLLARSLPPSLSLSLSLSLSFFPSFSLPLLLPPSPSPSLSLFLSLPLPLSLSLPLPLSLSLPPSLSPLPATCLEKLVVVAFTSGKPNSQSRQYHEINVKVGHKTKVIPLPMQFNDYQPLKGDLWELNFDSSGGPYGLGFDGCVTKYAISGITIEEGSNDGWMIESIFSLVCGNGQCILTTLDLHVQRWIDGNSKPEYGCFKLTKVW